MCTRADYPPYLEARDECDPDNPEAPCTKSCGWDRVDQRFYRSASWNGIDGEEPCRCEHHEGE